MFNYAGSRDFVAGQTLAVGQAPFGLTGGDFNGDGKLDVAVANEEDGTITCWGVRSIRRPEPSRTAWWPGMSMRMAGWTCW
ncbi:MAG: VCBS repeat-containing protein [Candidatus Eremiobacteraeota bacterium]|nr:VCBS repeat-containing protein [Candidatus Eremiobacteraeota bacterium]MCW5869773.1 VCBS repeat-containing protein [Candidatus Eremiobacteraeota bacterium]